MDAYESFASVYDQFMEEVDHASWTDHVMQVWNTLGYHPETVLDLGCGTGKATLLLAKAGYAMLGVDLSPEMLAQAQKKATAENLPVVFSCQDMIELQLGEKVDAVVSFCDCLNYLIDDGELEAAFSAVKDNLQPNGLFLFDMNTAFKFEQILGENTYAATSETSAYFWENTYDPEDKINEYYVSFFFKQDGKETYERVEEYHYERAYALEEVQASLEKIGFELLAVYDDYSFSPVQPETQRYFFVTRLKEETNNG